jgi:hypothetical protein
MGVCFVTTWYLPYHVGGDALFVPFFAHAIPKLVTSQRGLESFMVRRRPDT